MKHLGIKIMLAALLSFLTQSCGEDVDSYLEPEQATLITRIELQNTATESADEIVVPELKALTLAIVRIYNNGTEEPISAAEMGSAITWDLQTNDDISIVEEEGTGKIKLQGVGTANLTAYYNPDAKSGNRRLVSNTLSVTTVAPSLTSIQIVPAEIYSLGCPLSNQPNTRLVEGCLMQFTVLGIFDNGDQVDLTQDPELVLTSLNDTKAILVADLPAKIGKDWFALISSYITDHDLSERAGLILGTSIGGFRLSALYRGYQATSETVSVVEPALSALGLLIRLYQSGNCHSDCQLFENTVINLEATGTYSNNVVSEVTRQCDWTASEASQVVLENIGTEDNPIFTGKVEISYGVAEQVTFTATLKGLTETISASIAEEELEFVERDLPLGAIATGEITRMSNTEIGFRLKGYYNNDAFEILDEASRTKTLNLETYTWSTSNAGIVSLDTMDTLEATWDEKGYVIGQTKEVPDGSASTITASNSTTNVTWQVTINNSDSVPVSLSISPNNGSVPYELEAGVATPFSALAVFNNSNSKILGSGEVIWSSDPETCTVNGAQQSCISETGVVETYEPTITIVATTNFLSGTNISTTLQLNIRDTELESIEVQPATYTIYEKSTLHYSAIGRFSNNTSLELDENCVVWSLPEFVGDSAVIQRNGVLIAYDSLDATVGVKATSIANCGNTSEPTGRDIPGDISGDTSLTLQPLPRVYFETKNTTVNENTTITITAKATATIAEKMVIPLIVTDGSCDAGDFSLNSDRITILEGQTSGSVLLTLNQDSLDENDETLILSLSDSMVNAEPADTSTDIKITINDTNVPPTLSITNAAQNVDEFSDTMTVIFKLNPVSGRDVQVLFDVSPDSATPSEDYSVSATEVLIPAGQTDGILTVTIENDKQKEANETFTVTIRQSELGQYSIGSASQTITLRDDDKLEITNSPNPSCSANSAYTYQPTVNTDLTVTYSYYNLPDWLTFNGNLLSGQCSSTAEGILIYASDGEQTISVGPFSITVK